MRNVFAAIVASALCLVGRAEILYVTQSGAGSGNGSSIGNAFSASAFNTSGNWGSGAGKISAGDIVFLNGSFTTRLATQGSGTNASTRIIIAAYNPASPPVLIGLNGSSNDYIAVIGLTMTQTSNATDYAQIAWNGCDGWLVQGNYFNVSYRDAIEGSYASTNSNNIIRRNRFNDIGGIEDGYAGGASGASFVNVSGNSNLFEYNTSLLGMDRVRFFGTGCVARNNYFGPTDTSYYPDSDPYPFHTDGLQSYEGQAALVQLLWERNYDIDNRDSIGQLSNAPNGHNFIVQDGGSNNFNWYILRFNVAIREADSFAIFRNVDNIQAYNNTVVNMGVDKTSEFNNAVLFESPGCDVVDFRNNTFPYNQNMRDSGGIIINSNRTNFTSAANHSYNPSGQQVVLPTGASPANLSQTAPLFTDGDGTAGNDDYTLTSSSPLRGAGAYITLANGSGSNTTTLIVDDAQRLFDGWDIADADFITIGEGAEVQITSIDYDTDTVTLASARTWSDNDEVYVRGTTDVGALPYGAATAPSISSGEVTNLSGEATVTVADAFNVRFVEILENGIPVGSSYTPSGNVFTVTWTGDGATHTWTAVAYAAWASATPTVEMDITVAAGGQPAKALRNPATLTTGF